MDIVEMYLLYCDPSVVSKVYHKCEDIKEHNENSASSVRLANNLIDIH